MPHLLRRNYAVVALFCCMALFVAPGARAAAKSAAPPLDPAKRRLILMPGVVFTFQDSQARYPDLPGTGRGFGACDRAIGGFPALYRLLTNPKTTSPLGFSYTPEQVFAFDYSAVSASDFSAPVPKRERHPCVASPDPPVIPSTDPPLDLDPPPAADPSAAFTPVPLLPLRFYENDAVYTGAETRTRLSDTTRPKEYGTVSRFARQFSAWRADCPDCHFDIVAHSLGGAVAAAWAAGQASDDDLRHVHALITIDSPVNGATGPIDGVGIELIERLAQLFHTTGDLPLDLQGNAPFIAKMRDAPRRLDMRCISNVYDVLIPVEFATIRKSAARPVHKDLIAAAPSTLPGACDNVVGRYSKSDPYSANVGGFVAAAGGAHVEPLDHPDVLTLVVDQLARVTPRWAERNAALGAHLVAPVRSPLVPAGGDATITIRLENVGASAWEANGPVVLQAVDGTTFGLDRRQPLPGTINPGGTGQLLLRVHAPDRPGIYQSRWQLAYGDQSFGEAVGFSVIVPPAGGKAGAGALIGALAGELIADLERRVREELVAALDAIIRALLVELIKALLGAASALVARACGAPSALALAAIGVVFTRYQQGLRERQDDD